MSEQSLTPEEIATIMAGRGMSLKDGAKTILRLQTVWGLRELDLTSRRRNARHNAQRQAKNQQEKEFLQYARELGLDNPAEWVKRKMNEPQILEKRKDQTMKLMTELAPELVSDSPGPGRGRRSTGANTTSNTTRQANRNPISHGNSGDTSAGQESDSPDAALQNATRRTWRTTQRTALPASQLNFADNEDGDPDDSDFEPEDANFDFDPDPSADSHSFPQGIDHDDDTGSESDDADGDVESMEIDASRHAAQSAQTTIASFAPAIQPTRDLDSLVKLVNSATACINAAQTAKDTLEARIAMKPIASSLTCMPPSAQEVEAARYKLKDAARMILETF